MACCLVKHRGKFTLPYVILNSFKCPCVSFPWMCNCKHLYRISIISFSPSVKELYCVITLQIFYELFSFRKITHFYSGLILLPDWLRIVSTLAWIHYQLYFNSTRKLLCLQLVQKLILSTTAQYKPHENIAGRVKHVRSLKVSKSHTLSTP